MMLNVFATPQGQDQVERLVEPLPRLADIDAEAAEFAGLVAAADAEIDPPA
jgi:hypothetical protein